MRLIDADALVIMLGLKPDEWNTPDERWRPESEFGLWIINAPTIEPKRGRWIEEYNGNGWNDYWDYTCSVCEKTLKRGEPYPYCPNCGAKMYDPCEDCQEFSCDYCPNRRSRMGEE